MFEVKWTFDVQRLYDTLALIISQKISRLEKSLHDDREDEI